MFLENFGNCTVLKVEKGDNNDRDGNNYRAGAA